MTQSGIEHRCPKQLANTLPTIYIYILVCVKERHKNAMHCIDQIMKVTLHKTPVMRPPLLKTFKKDDEDIRGTAREATKNSYMTFNGSLHMPMLLKQQ